MRYRKRSISIPLMTSNNANQVSDDLFASINFQISELAKKEELSNSPLIDLAKASSLRPGDFRV